MGEIHRHEDPKIDACVKAGKNENSEHIQPVQPAFSDDGMWVPQALARLTLRRIVWQHRVSVSPHRHYDLKAYTTDDRPAAHIEDSRNACLL